jgi:hypothetical protein
MTLNLALHDAARNCERDQALATLTLKSGAAISGKLERPAVGEFAGKSTVQVRKPDGGWATVLVAEIAAVEVTPTK